MKTDKEIYNDRIKNNKFYGAYIPSFLAIPFDEKLKKENISYSNFLKKSIEKFLKKN